MKSFFFKSISIILLFFLLYSCNSKREFSTSKRRYSKGYYVSSKKSVHAKGNYREKENALAELPLKETPKATTDQAELIPFQPYSSKVGKGDAELKQRIAGRSTLASIIKEPYAEKIRKIKYALPALKKSKNLSLTGDDGSDLLLGIVLLLVGTAVLVAAYYFYLTPSAPGGLVLALALIIIGSVIASIGSYMIRQSLGMNNMGCNSCNSPWFF